VLHYPCALAFVHPALTDPDKKSKGLQHHANLSVFKCMTANGDARREVIIRSLEVLSNLFYLIRTQSDNPFKVTEYATLADAQIKLITEALN